jgi:amidase/aspartyl-tRNA(Asn)/glutamyl-tRNA(Gln) amidotransferase subunit A
MDGLSCFTPAVELAKLIRAREVSVVEVTSLHLQRIERRNPALGAYVCVCAEEALASARERQRQLDRGERVGSLHGLPVAIKDLEDVAGVPTRSGSRATPSSPAAEDAIFVQRMREAGAVFLGKTNAPEFGHKGTTDSLLFGPASSPFRAGTNAGGSSGGAAAAVADGLAAIAQGGDGGGSIRIPAALCGVYGIKPSWGRVPHVYRPGAFPFTPFVSHGPLARTVQDAALMLAAMVGPHPRDPLSIPDEGLDLLGACERSIEGLRVAYSPKLGVFPVSAEVSEVVARAVGALEQAGALVEEVEPQIAHSQQELSDVWLRSVAVQYAQMVAGFRVQGVDLLAAGTDGLEPDVLHLVHEGEEISALGCKLDDIVRTQVFDAVQDVFADYDLLVSPTCSVAAVENATDGGTVGPSEVDGEAVDPLIGWCLTHPFNFTGHPAASVPAGLTDDGLPVGMQVVARRHREDVVLAASAAVQRSRPWAHAYPGLREG